VQDSVARVVVEVVHAGPGGAVRIRLEFEHRATVGDALRLAAGHPSFSTIDTSVATLAIFGRPAGRERHLRDGDRIEIHTRPAVDPKLARRARAGGARGRKARGKAQ
jgi:putative ubiquitin-RnfH superfamily antitoxin RatB of RatAB toxin-antitoxin module